MSVSDVPVVPLESVKRFVILLKNSRDDREDRQIMREFEEFLEAFVPVQKDPSVENPKTLSYETPSMLPGVPSHKVFQ